jgi:O-antigen ligase
MSTIADPQPSNLRLILFILTLISVAGVTFSVALSSIAMGAGIFVCIVLIFREGKSGIPKTTLEIFFLAYIFAEILSTLFSVEPAHSAVNMKRLILISLVYLTAISVANESLIRRAVLIIIVCASLFSFAELFTLRWVDGHLARLSQFQYFTTEGGIKMFVTLIALPLIGVSLIPLFAALVLTQTRSSWLGLVAGIVTIALFQKRVLLFILIGVIVLFLLFAPGDLRSRAFSIFDPSMTSNLTRIHMITTGWEMFLDRPLVGWGDIDLKQYYVTYTVPIDHAEGGHLHNNFMMLLVTLGIVGFAATMLLFIKIFLLEWKIRSVTKKHWLYGSLSLGCLAAYIGFHVNGLFEWNFGDHEIAVLLWFSVGLIVAIRNLIPEHEGKLT